MIIVLRVLRVVFPGITCDKNYRRNTNNDRGITGLNGLVLTLITPCNNKKKTQKD
jgi:hypothetical protein